MTLILLLNLASTLFMTGLIWFVQIVHYPLFARVGPRHFVGYEDAHRRLTTFVVAPVMLIELVSAVLLATQAPSGPARVLSVAALALLSVVWLSTWLLQVPAHAALTAAFSQRQHRRLVVTNWCRTVAWTLRAGLLFILLSQLPGMSDV